jgi:hypothetical protein
VPGDFRQRHSAEKPQLNQLRLDRVVGRESLQGVVQGQQLFIRQLGRERVQLDGSGCRRFESGHPPLT